MAWFSRDPEKDRYYLLPGMGGRAHRRKHRFTLIWAVVIGLLVSGAMAGLLYLIHTSGSTG